MLTQIQRSDRALKKAHDELEERVEQRTAELSQANAALQVEIGERLDVDDTTVSKDLKNSQLGKIQVDLGEHWNDKGVAEVANRPTVNPFSYSP